MDVTSLYINIHVLQEKGIITVYNAYKHFHKYKPPIPSNFLRDMLRLILKVETEILNESTEKPDR